MGLYAKGSSGIQCRRDKRFAQNLYLRVGGEDGIGLGNRDARCDVRCVQDIGPVGSSSA